MSHGIGHRAGAERARVAYHLIRGHHELAEQHRRRAEVMQLQEGSTLFRNALPVRWTGPTFNAGGDEVGFESLELAHEGLTKPLLGQAAALARGIAGIAG
jgi:hypothetical protein